MRIELENVNANKLHDELIKAGITPELVEGIDGITIVTVTKEQEGAVRAVVAMHNPVPPPTPKSEVEELREQVAQLQEVIDTMLTGGEYHDS